jgi:Apea-like HEPN
MRVADFEAILLSRRAELQPFADLEDLVFFEDEHPSAKLKSLTHHMWILRKFIAKELWGRGIYVGVSVLDNLVFRATRDSATQHPVKRVLEYIRGYGLHHPGLVVYPLHSFGIAGAGAFDILTKGTIRFYEKNQGILITPQTNGIGKTVQFIESAAAQLGVRRRVPRDLIEHWTHSRPTEWLSRNPLLALRVRSFPGSYYENQFFLIIRLQVARATVLMLAVLENDAAADEKSWSGSSANVNNWETLDIKHYLAFYPHVTKRRMLDGDCVPMNARMATLADISQLAVNLHPKHWARRSKQTSLVAQTLDNVSAEVIRSHVDSKNTTRSRVANKLWTSAKYFSQSFRRSDRPEDAIVALAVGFEVLLTDNYSSGIEAVIARRLRLALKGARGTRSMQLAVERLYDARSESVHKGQTGIQIDLNDARKTFVHAFLGVAQRMSLVPVQSAAPIGVILGDK